MCHSVGFLNSDIYCNNMLNIPDIMDNCKKSLGTLLKGDMALVLIITLLAGASFGLGRLSTVESTKGEIRIEYPNAVTRTLGETGGLAAAGASIDATVSTEGGEFVASKNSTVYHLPWCSGAKRINDANKIYFASKGEAEAAGYRPAANCPGI
jgi:hypothetical protein